ncbi:MAG: nuclear transport factor 2 family protein [Actinomycetota bacterium]|nr:nuclear transport factor 2 family protein [Actinomycetota bacterium]
MSQENVELAHRAYDAVNRRDLETFLAFIDPEVEFVSGSAFFEGGSYRGHDGVRKWWRDIFSVYPDWRTEVLDVRDVGDDHLIASLRGRGHGAGSGVPIDQVHWQLVQLREGKVIWWRTYVSEAEALKAAGLSE